MIKVAPQQRIFSRLLRVVSVKKIIECLLTDEFKFNPIRQKAPAPSNSAGHRPRVAFNKRTINYVKNVRLIDLSDGIVQLKAPKTSFVFEQREGISNISGLILDGRLLVEGMV